LTFTWLALLSLKKFPVSILLALLGLVSAILYVVRVNQPAPRPVPVRPPVKKPYLTALAGTGLVEARAENIAVMPFYQGKVAQVAVHEGQQVQPGQILYALDTSSLRAALAVQKATRDSQEASLQRLLHEPRPEDLPPLEAAVAQAGATQHQQEAQLANARSVMGRLEKLWHTRAVSQDEVTRQRYTVAAAEAQLAAAQAQLRQASQELKRVQAGAWRYDIQKTRADLAASQARIDEQETQRSQAFVRAPVAGQVLQVNIRAGEAISPTQTTAPVLMGETRRLQVRVDIDEVNAHRVRPGMPAVAVLRGDADKKFPLEFDHIIPYMVPKRNLTGANTERVDVRVLQVIYTFQPPAFPVYVGQQVDVFLDVPQSIPQPAPSERPPA
jgi:multidrug resistance efflux pump